MHPPRKAPGTMIHGVLLACARQALLDLDRMERWPDHAIHCLRVRMKKLHGLLLLVKDQVAPATLRSLKALARKLRKAFAQHRDCQVQTELSAELSGSEPASCPPPKDSKVLLRKARRLAGVAAQLIENLASLELEGLAWEQVFTAHTRHFVRCRHRLKKARQHPTPENLHRLRKAVKDLYYQTLLLRRLKHARTRLKRARKLGSCLGKLHDVDRFLALPDTQPGHLHQAAKKRRQQLECRALHRAHRLLKD